MLQLPDAEFPHIQSTIYNESLYALEIAKASGRAKYIGLAGYSPQIMQ